MQRLNNFLLMVCGFFLVLPGCVGVVYEKSYQGLEFTKDIRFEGVTVDEFIVSLHDEIGEYKVRSSDVCSEPYVMFKLHGGGVYVLELDMSELMLDEYRCAEELYKWKDWFDEGFKQAIIVEAVKIEKRMYKIGQSSGFRCVITKDGSKICESNEVEKERNDVLYKDMNPEDYLFDELLIVE